MAGYCIHSLDDIIYIYISCDGVTGDVITIYDCAWLVLEVEAGDIICVFNISKAIIFFLKKKGLLLGFGIITNANHGCVCLLLYCIVLFLSEWKVHQGYTHCTLICSACVTSFLCVVRSFVTCSLYYHFRAFPKKKETIYIYIVSSRR